MCLCYGYFCLCCFSARTLSPAPSLESLQRDRTSPVPYLNNNEQLLPIANGTRGNHWQKQTKTGRRPPPLGGFKTPKSVVFCFRGVGWGDKYKGHQGQGSLLLIPDKYQLSSLRREQNDNNNKTEHWVNNSSDLVKHPLRYRYRVWPQTLRDFVDSVNRSFALRIIIVIVWFPPESHWAYFLLRHASSSPSLVPYISSFVTCDLSRFCHGRSVGSPLTLE